jgi:hypothetical protein
MRLAPSVLESDCGIAKRVPDRIAGRQQGWPKLQQIEEKRVKATTKTDPRSENAGFAQFS